MNTIHAVRVSVATLTALLGVSLSSAALAMDSPEPTPVEGKIDWVYEYQEGQRLSKASGKPMFVVLRCER